MFDNFRTIRRFRNDAAKVKIGETVFYNEKAEGKSRHLRSAFRFAACAAVAVAVVLTGTVWLPGQHLQSVSGGDKSAAISAKSSAVQMASHDFTLQACAAETSSGGATISTSSGGATISTSSDNNTNKVTLKPNLTVELPQGEIKYDSTSGQDNGNCVGFSTLDGMGFICTGDKLVSVNYTAKSGKLNYNSDEQSEQVSEAYKNSLVCTIKISKSKLESGEIFEAFKKLWDSGELDEYRDKYFNGGSIDLTATA
jgi:hypothetical protein